MSSCGLKIILDEINYPEIKFCGASRIEIPCNRTDEHTALFGEHWFEKGELKIIVTIPDDAIWMG